jgi:hypothetical protein
MSNSAKTNGTQAVKTITGRFIAKATVSYPRWRRAEDAVRWLRGELQIKPTAKQAAEIFHVNAPLMKAARERLDQQERGKRHGNGGAASLSDTTVERIVVSVGPERILRVIDKLTSPELPLVAAE